MAVAIVLAVFACVFAPLIYMFIKLERASRRNEEVFFFRMRLLNVLTLVELADKRAGRSSKWRYAVFDSVSYDDMMKSRRPLSSLYPNASFLNPRATDPNARPEEPADSAA